MRRSPPYGAAVPGARGTGFPGIPGAGRRWGVVATLVAAAAVGSALYAGEARPCASNAAAMEVRERVFELHIADGRVADDARTVRAWEGDTVRLRWTADEPVVLRVVGYGIGREVAPGEPAEIAFKADVTGRFPVQSLSGPGRPAPLATVEIYPR